MAIDLTKLEKRFIDLLENTTQEEFEQWLLSKTESKPMAQTAVDDKTIAEKYDELCKEVTRLQEKYDENGYDCSPMIKLQRIEATVDSVIKHYHPHKK